MALSLVATVGASTANAYDTVANADAYFLAHPEWTTWDKLYTPDKVRYLIQATRQIDALVIDGPRYTTTATSGVPDQALKFPRGQDYDDGATFIPVPVKYAMFEQALYLGKIGSDSTRAALIAAGVTSATVGDVSETYQANANMRSHELCDRAYDLLNSAGLIVQGASL